MGVRLFVENCPGPSAHYEFAFRGNVLERHRPADDVTFGGPRVLEVFSKPADQPIEEAIQRTFVDKLEPAAREGCRAQRLSPSPLRGDKVAVAIVPTGSYRKAIEEEMRREGPRDFGCGPYGARQEETYFEYHPAESRTSYAHVVFGWDDAPMFDENSIEFLR